MIEAEKSSAKKANEIAPAIHKNTGSANTSAPAQLKKSETPRSLTPQEISTLLLWGESIGYFPEEMMLSDYNSMSRETLLALAAQHDPKAHLLLANRILQPLTGGKAAFKRWTKLHIISIWLPH